MDILNIISLLGAIAVFLFGMSIMTDGLENLSSGRLESILERMTSNVFKGLLLGAGVTAIIQSSSATTVMCVGFVNAGIMTLRQTVGIIMGANIGTTVTAQLLRLGDISSESFLLLLLKPSALGPILATVGILLYLFFSQGRKKNIGQIFIGLGLLFIGMKTMETAVAPLQDLPQFAELFATLSNPFLGILAGALITALIQSSSASVGILQAVSSTGVVPFSAAFPIIMGQNIGTCITALLSSIGASRNAKRTAALHLSFNIIGTLLFTLVLYASNAIFKFDFWDQIMDRGSIANVHIIFNIGCTALLLPFNKQLVNLAIKLVPGNADSREFDILDERFLSAPAVALDRCSETVQKMGTYARENYTIAIELLEEYDSKKLALLHETERAIDKMEVRLDAYLVKLTDHELTGTESFRVSELFHTLSDFERIGDYVVNLTESATTIHEKNLHFSPKAKRELYAITQAVGDAFDLTLEAYSKNSRSLARQVEPIEEVVDLLHEYLKNKHIERLKNSKCTIELGTQFLELLTNLERISDHCANVALYILRERASEGDLIRVDSHAYIHALHHGGNEEFDGRVKACHEKYTSMMDE